MQHENTTIFMDLKPYLKTNTITLETIKNINKSNIQNKSFYLTYALNILKKSKNYILLNEIYLNINIFKNNEIENIINTIDSIIIIEEKTINKLLKFNKENIKKGIKYESLLLLEKLGIKRLNIEGYKQLYELFIEDYYYLSALKCLKKLKEINVKNTKQFEEDFNFLKTKGFKNEIDFNKFFDDLINYNSSIEFKDLIIKENKENYLKNIKKSDKDFLNFYYEKIGKFILINNYFNEFIKNNIKIEVDDERIKILGYKYENIKNKVDSQIRNLKKEEKKNIKSFSIKIENKKPIENILIKKEIKTKDYFTEKYLKFRIYLKNTKIYENLYTENQKKRIENYQNSIKNNLFLIKHIEAIKKDIEKLKKNIESSPQKLLKELKINETKSETKSDVSEIIDNKLKPVDFASDFISKYKNQSSKKKESSSSIYEKKKNNKSNPTFSSWKD